MFFYYVFVNIEEVKGENNLSKLKKHPPDYQEELDRLIYTKDYMESILELAHTSKDQVQENIKDAFTNLDYLDSSLSYINILTNSRLLDMIQGDLRQLIKMKENPYFGRIDFIPADSAMPEKYYIGKFSLYRKDNQEPIVVDWRSPVANLYYDGRLGQVSYQAEERERFGDLNLKRQYVIEEGDLEEIRDIDVTSRDELLQKSLSEKSDKRLNDIVATIQEEQNRVIRQDLQKPMIVQGVAGSGKTTIALHRLSYFLYQYQDKLSPDKVMILAPNNMFIDYISQALPDLGVEKITQTTYNEYVQACIRTKINMIDSTLKLKDLLETTSENKEETIIVSQLKGSIKYESVMKEYLIDIIKNYVPKEDLYIGKFKFFSYKKIQKLFLKDYRYLTIDQRKEKINQLLKKEFKSKKKEIIDKIEEKFEEKYESILFKYQDAEERKVHSITLLDNKEQRLKEVKAETFKTISQYMRKFPKHSSIDYYKNLLTDEKLFKQYSQDILDESEIDLILKQTAETVKKNQFETEDLAGILYLQAKLFGIPEDFKMKYIVIDEGQDYSLFQYRALAIANQTRLFTILGDLAQGIHQYRGTNNWEDILNHLLPKANYITLQKSYRTTIEIMDLANQLLMNQANNLPLAEPVVRHDNKPQMLECKTDEEIFSRCTQLIDELNQHNYTSIAFITKTEKEAEELTHKFNNDSTFEVQLLQGKEAMSKNIVIVPAHLAKGLEFDVAILVNMNTRYNTNELETKLLYVAITRACIDYISLVKSRLPFN